MFGWTNNNVVLNKITCCNSSRSAQKNICSIVLVNHVWIRHAAQIESQPCEMIRASHRGRGVPLMKASSAVTGKWRGSARPGSAWDAAQTLPLAPTVRIHCVLQSTSPSPVPLSFFSSFSSSCSRVKISLGFLYWRRERRQRFTCTFSSSPCRKSLNVLALLKGQDKQNRTELIYSWKEANILLNMKLFCFLSKKREYWLKQKVCMHVCMCCMYICMLYNFLHFWTNTFPKAHFYRGFVCLFLVI